MSANSYSTNEIKIKQSILYEDAKAEEIIELVEKLNAEVFEQSDDEGFFLNPFEALFMGGVAFINFMDCEIWTSEENERQTLDEESEEKEPLEQYIRKEANGILNSMRKVIL